MLLRRNASDCQVRQAEDIVRDKMERNPMEPLLLKLVGTDFHH